ncbi:MAG: hypothetical protein ABI790_09835 [Betaproteobacteria bacterium]
MSLQTGVARSIAVAFALAVLSGCSTVTRLEGASPGTTLAIRGISRTELPRSEDLSSKATGQYEFMATTADGKRLYGLLPLKVNGGTMTMSILFFAPALFIGGFRDVFPFYQVDPDKNVMRFKMNEADEWRQYQPLMLEKNRSKEYFDTLK